MEENNKQIDDPLRMWDCYEKVYDSMLGSGRTSEVFKVRRKSDQKIFAAKSRKKHISDIHFAREINNLKLLDSAPNTVKFVEAFDEGHSHN